MNTGYFTIYFHFLQLLSSMSYTFFMYISFTPWVKFIPKYSIVFDTIINRIVFLICFFNNSLLVYKTITDFCMLILYPTILINSFLCSKIFWWSHWTYLTSCHIHTQTILLLTFKNACLLFIFLCWLL